MENSTGLPVVIERTGNAITNSRDVAAYFGKEHRNVLRSIDELVSEGCLLNFEQMSISAKIGNGAARDFRTYNMTRDGFTLLAMGFTGKRALRFKLAYIEAFNRMEAELRERARAVPELSINQRLRIVQEARRTLGADAARTLWGELDLPRPVGVVDPLHQPTKTDIEAKILALVSGGWIRRRDLHRQTRRWSTAEMDAALVAMVQSREVMEKIERRSGGGWPVVSYRRALH